MIRFGIENVGYTVLDQDNTRDWGLGGGLTKPVPHIPNASSKNLRSQVTSQSAEKVPQHSLPELSKSTFQNPSHFKTLDVTPGLDSVLQEHRNYCALFFLVDFHYKSFRV